MINGLGLFAALGSPDASAPQPAPAEDPAVFAAALVAALGLRAVIQETPIATAPSPDAPGESSADESEPEAAEGEGSVVANTEYETPTVDGKSSRPNVARVTPDPEVVKETATLGVVLRGEAPVQKGNVVDRVSDEPAAPGLGSRALQPTGSELAASDTPVQGTEAVVTKPSRAVAAPKADPATAEVATDVANLAETGDEKPVTRRPSERRGARAGSHADTVELAGGERSVPAPLPAPEAASTAAQSSVAAITALTPAAAADKTAAPASSVREVPDARASETSRPTAPVPQAAGAGPTNAVADAARQVAESTPAPPQSVDERTARAMAENTRVERQLAELLGDAEVTEFKVQLGRRPATQAQAPVADTAASTDRASEGKVVWQRANPLTAGDTISGQMLPQPTPRAKADRNEARGTFAREAVEAVNVQSVSSEPVTISSATARSEIVRMVANASRAMAPNVVATEGTPAVAKSPAPSMAPSLPVVRQELPADSARSLANDVDERDRKPAHDASASDAASPSSPPVANNATASPSRSERAESGEPREARNLPSHGSTDQKAAGSADRVTLQVADEEGRQTRIRVSVTGNQIRAVITPPDSASARQLEQRMDQLHETLVRQGFVDPKLVVRAAPEAVSDAAMMASASSQDVRSTIPAGKDQPAGEQRQGRGQREQDRGDGHRHPQGHSRGRDPRDRRR